MKEIPIISVVIPVFNGERFLTKAIDSVISQTYRPLEIIVIDDGSTDSTKLKLTAYPEVKYFYQNNQGVSSARNLGIKKASGELITFLDHDDLLISDSIQRRADYFHNNLDINCLITMHQSFLEQGFDQPPWIPDTEFKEGTYGFGYLMAKRSMLEKVGGFNPKFRTGEFMEFFFHLKDFGFEIAKLPEITVLRRIHGENLSKNVRAMRENLLKSAKASIERQKGSSESNEK